MGKIVVRVYTNEATSKAFGVDDETVGDLAKNMGEKLELPEGEARKWGIVEKKPDGERFPDITEKVQSIVSAWEKEKKKNKSATDTDYQFWWKQKPAENRTIRVHFLDGTFKAVVVNADTTASQLHEAVAQKIELTNDVNFGLFDQRKKGDRPIPPSENILSIMDDWKRNLKKGDKEEDNRFVFRLKTPMQNEDVVEDPVRVHLLYLEARNGVANATTTPSVDDMILLAALEIQINFGDHNPKVHVDGFLVPKLKELIPKKVLSHKKDKEWEKDIFKQHNTHKGMRPLFAKLEYLQIINPSFRASASIVAINKAEQQKRDEEEVTKKAKAAAAKAAPPAAAAKPAAGGAPAPPPPPPVAAKAEEEDINAFPSMAELTATTVSARVSSRFDLINAIEEGVNLKRAEDTNDRSAPKIDGSVKIKKSNRGELLSEIGKGAELKKSDTVDKSAPNVAGAKVKKIDRKGMLEGIESSEKKLKKTETVDKSAPKFSHKKANHGDVFSDINKGAKLKKTETVDRSGPVVDKAVKVKKYDRKGMLNGIEQGTKLKKTETRDASGPQIQKDVTVNIGARSNLLASIEEGKTLHHVTEADKIPKGEGVIRRKHPVVQAPPGRGPKPILGGAPKPPPKPPTHFGAPPPPPPPSIKANAGGSRMDVLQSIEAGARLKKTETVDKSGPKVEKEVKIKKVDRAGLLNELSTEKKLKKAETVDKSGPITEGVKVKKIDRKGMLEGIAQGDAKLKKVDTVDKSAPTFKQKKVDRGAVLSDIATGEKKLKKAQTVDKSAPVVERVKVKKVDRQGLIRGIEAGIDLKPTDTKDSSAPVIDVDVKVKKSDDKRGGRGGLLDAIEKGTTLKKTEGAGGDE